MLLQLQNPRFEYCSSLLTILWDQYSSSQFPNCLVSRLRLCFLTDRLPVDLWQPQTCGPCHKGLSARCFANWSLPAHNVFNSKQVILFWLPTSPDVDLSWQYDAFSTARASRLRSHGPLIAMNSAPERSDCLVHHMCLIRTQ